MATNAEDVAAQGAETEPLEPGQQQPDSGQQPEPGKEQQAEETPEEIQNLAREIGWTPREEYNGPPERWKPADQFIRESRDIQRTYRRDIDRLQRTIDTMSRTTAAVAEQEITRRVEELTGRYNKAVEDGDAPGAFKIAREIGTLTMQPAAPGAGAPPPEAQQFAQRNASWFQKDPLGTALAIDICNRLAAQGYDHQTQLEAAEKEVRRVYPHLFGQVNGHKPQAQVNRPGSRGPQSNNGKPKGFADMPLASQKIAEDMVARGVFPGVKPEEAKARFAENYWREEQRKA